MPLTVDPGTLDALRSLRGEMQALAQEQAAVIRQREQIERMNRADAAPAVHLGVPSSTRGLLPDYSSLGRTIDDRIRRVDDQRERRDGDREPARIREAILRDPGLSHLSPQSLRRSIMGTVHAYEMLKEGRVNYHMTHVPAHALELAGNLAGTAGAPGLASRLSRYAGFLGGPAIGGAMFAGVFLAEKWQEFQKAQEDTVRQSKATRQALWDLEAVYTRVAPAGSTRADQGRALTEIQKEIGGAIKQKGEFVFGKMSDMPETAQRLQALAKGVGAKDWGEELSPFQAVERGTGFAAQIISQASKDFRFYALARQQTLGAEIHLQNAIKGTRARTPAEIQNELLGMLQEERGVERLAELGQRMRAMAAAARKPEAVVLKERVIERQAERQAQALVHSRRLAAQDWTPY